MRVAEVMRRSIEVVHLHEPLTRVRERFDATGLDAMPIVDGDRIVGILGQADLEQALGSRIDVEAGAVRDLDAPEAAHCLETHSVEEARAVMDSAGLDWLIVLDGREELAGLVGRADLPSTGRRAAAPPPRPGADDAREDHAGLKVYAQQPRLQSAPGGPRRPRPGEPPAT